MVCRYIILLVKKFVKKLNEENLAIFLLNFLLKTLQISVQLREEFNFPYKDISVNILHSIVVILIIEFSTETNKTIKDKPSDSQ